MDNHQMVLDTVFQALTDPTRRAIIERLSEGVATVSELAEPFNMALPSFMKHIRILEDSGLIDSTKTGRVRTCKIKPRKLETAEKWLNERRIISANSTECS